MRMESIAAWEGFLEKIKKALLSHYGEDLFAVVIFGSAARGDFQKGSDLDLLIILQECQDSLGKRIDEFMKMEWEMRKSPEYACMKAQGFPHRIEPVILDLEEFRKHPPLLLDLTSDAKVLIDRENVFANEMNILRRRLQELGAKKVILEGGRWYWILKPQIKWGEKVVL
jgi:predicted nucleotidyltransferase